MHINFEFKAKADDLTALEQKLQGSDPVFIGEDHQIDTYFNVKKGRLKLREGDIENSLIYYERQDIKGAKQSEVLLYDHHPSAELKKILVQAHGIKAIVDKQRRIYFVDNIKFHFDTVKGIGCFIEVEAIDKTGELGLEKVTGQCNSYAQLFGIREEDYISNSYSDLVLSMAPVEEKIKLSGITSPV